jgi:type IV secretion system protein VirB2
LDIDLQPHLGSRNSQPKEWLLEVPMSRNVRLVIPHRTLQSLTRILRHIGFVALAVLTLPIAAHAQSASPFDTGFTNLQNLFTGTVAKVASLIAIVIGGYGFAHGEPGAKKALAGVAAGTGIAVLAANVLSWLWGV